MNKGNFDGAPINEDTITGFLQAICEVSAAFFTYGFLYVKKTAFSLHSLKASGVN